MAELRVINITAVLGVPGVGKTTYARELATKSDNRAIFLPVGRWMRDAFGEQFFVDQGSKGRSDRCEHWVRNNVHHAIIAGVHLRKDVVIDGFPLGQDQSKWLFTKLTDTMHRGKVGTFTLLTLTASDEVLDARLAGRSPSHSPDRELSRRRRDSVNGLALTSSEYFLDKARNERTKWVTVETKQI